MELWIRSQDKLCLVKQYAFIDIFNPCEEDEEFIDRSIYAYIDKDTQVFLGEYKTPERALEVLDEIQDILEKNQPSIISYSNGDIVNINGNYIYEMPKE